MVRVRVRHFNVVEAELKAATDEAQRIAIPVQQAAGSGGHLKLAAAGGAQQNNTENRWLGRMLSNALAEVRARADTYDAAGALLKETVAGMAEEVEKLGQSKKRKRAEVEELAKRTTALQKEVLKKVETQCVKGLESLRPDADAAASAAADSAAAAASAAPEASSAVLKEIDGLGQRAKKCAVELGERSEALGGRIESLRTTAGAASSFLQSKPSKVDLAIRQSQRRQQEEEGEEGDKGPKEEKKGKQGQQKENASGVSALADLVAPVM